MTLEAMRQAGVPVAERPGLRSFEVLHAAYQPFAAAVEADWSQAGFWYAANFLDSRVEIRGLNPDSGQGDKVVSELYWKLARPGDAEIDVSGCPDLLPPLAVMAAVRSGTTRFVNAARLRMKESDRLSTIAAAADRPGRPGGGGAGLPDRSGAAPSPAARWTAPTTTGSPWRRPSPPPAAPAPSPSGARSACKNPTRISGRSTNALGGDIHVL